MEAGLELSPEEPKVRPPQVKGEGRKAKARAQDQ